MRVALDTNPIYTTRAGVARYVRGLRKGLSELHSSDVKISEIAWQVANFDYRQPMRALKTFSRELVWAPFVAPALLKRAKIDLLHSTSGSLITPPRNTREVVTLHDLAVVRFPHRFRRWHRMSAQARLKKLHRADRIICVSKFTADEAMSLLDLPSRKLEVIYNGADALPLDGATGAAAVPELPTEFLLFVGSLEPGKNLSLLKQMYSLPQNSGSTLPPLVIVGARWAGVTTEGTRPKNWIYLGTQPDDVLALAYRKARALLFPSIYEGFGLPVVEAQSLGCPVVCSPVASLPEVAGKGALVVPLTPIDYLTAVSRLEHDPDLRNNLIQEGISNIARFSWRRCANDTVGVYKTVAG
jgi:glycosyltransferase involved in cell wall biosynthesis